MRFIAFVCSLFLSISSSSADPPIPVRIKDGGPIRALVFAPKQDKIAVLQDIKDEVLIRFFAFPSLDILGKIVLTEAYTGAAFSPCGNYFAMNGAPDKPATVRIWDVRHKPKPIKLLRSQLTNTVTDRPVLLKVTFSEDGEQVFSTDSEPRLYCWSWKKSDRSEREITFNGALKCDYAYFLTPNALIGRTEFGCYNLLAFHKGTIRLQKRIDYEVDRWLYFDSDLKTAVSWNNKTHIIEVIDISKNLTVVDRIANYQNHPHKARGLVVHDVTCTKDRSIVMVSYNDRGRLAYIAFFPRTPARFREFGLDPRSQTHVVLRIVSEDEGLKFAPQFHFSPDGRWFVLEAGNNLDLRFWEVETLGRALLAEKQLVSKW